MADYGIKISKSGHDATDSITEATKKNFILLDSTEAHKMIYADYVTGGSYTHGLGYMPFFFAFDVDSTDAPTKFEMDLDAVSTTTTISSLPDPAYLIIFNEGELP